MTKENNVLFSFVSDSFCTFVASRVITLKHNNEELRNTNGCYLVTQFSSNPTNRFILSELSFLAKVAKRFLCDQIFAVEIFITHCNQNYCCLSLNHQKFFDKGLSLCSKIAFEERPCFYWALFLAMRSHHLVWLWINCG